VPIYARTRPTSAATSSNNSESVLLFVDHDQPEGQQPGRLSRVRSRCRVPVGEESGAPSKERPEGIASGRCRARRFGEAAHRREPARFEERARA